MVYLLVAMLDELAEIANQNQSEKEMVEVDFARSEVVLDNKKVQVIIEVEHDV